MNVTLDPHLFTQIGLDSGSITMLGTVVHMFHEPGEYRCVVHQGQQVKAVFIVSSDKSSPVAQASIDLESLVSGPAAPHPKGCSCCSESSPGGAAPVRFVVNPRGYVLFHVSRGAGGYYVHARRMDADEEDKGFDSRALVEGDVFTAILLRPGTYSMANGLTGARGEVVVTYPKREGKRYQPPPPVRVAVSQKALDPNKVQVDPGQGIIFESHSHVRIVIRLENADDGPKGKGPAASTGRIATRVT